MFDLNGDGYLTTAEVLKSAWVSGGSYRNDDAQVIPPKRTIISEIEVPDDFLLDDLNIQISITHTYVGYLDAYLTGPEGERVELFTAVGGSGDHFNQTVIDDQSSYSIAKGKAPFEGSFRPEAIDKKQPGLRIFNGKSVKGVWQLVIRGTRNDRFGMLHGWSMTARPSEELPEIMPSDDADSESPAAPNANSSDQAAAKPATASKPSEQPVSPPPEQKGRAITAEDAKEAASDILKELSKELNFLK